MTSQTPRTLLAAPTGRLTALVEHCTHVRSIDRLVHDHLPAPLGLHCRVANLRAGRLVLHTDSPVWHSMLRYHCPALLAHLRVHPGLDSLREILVKTVPSTGPETVAPPIRRRLSPESATLIADLAASIADPRLRRALRHLGRSPAR